MKCIAVVTLALCSAGLQAATPKKNSAATPKNSSKAAAPTRKAAARPAPPAVVIPASATRVDENTYTHIDAQGKTWVYRKTPFGIQKTERTTESTPYGLPDATRDRQSPFSAEGSQRTTVQQTEEQVTATEAGDSVTFQKKTPFGNNIWTKKRAELNDDEKALLDRAKAR
jgi:hypothetical protein